MKQAVKYKFLSSTCRATGSATKDKAGDTSEGWWSAGGGLKDLASASSDQDPYVQTARRWLTSAGYDYKEPIMNAGMTYAFTLQQALLIGGDLPGGRTRTNFIVASTGPVFPCAFQMFGGSIRSTVSTWSMAWSNEATRLTPVTSAQATR